MIAATASYLTAHENSNGKTDENTSRSKWLLRIEDVDTQRKKTGASTSIIKTLEAYGFEWDGEIIYQSQRTDAYQAALESIQQHSYPCSCTRKELQATTPQGTNSYLYPGFCRTGLKNSDSTHLSIRLKTNNKIICFDDKCQNTSLCQNIQQEIGDFIIKRSDGLFAYQLAVVVDDAWQGVTDIVRGADLYDNTPQQIFLQQILGYSQPNYLHFPVAIDQLGKKLSKHNFSPEVSIRDKRTNIINALNFLGQETPSIDNFSSSEDLWAWALKNWDSAKIPRKMTKSIDNE